MATQRPAFRASVGAFADRLLAGREVIPRAQVIAAEASARLGGIPAVVYLFDPAAEPRWSSKASVGEVKVPASCEALTLAMVADQAEAIVFSGAELVREHYAHLDVRRTIISLAYLPLTEGEKLLGAVEAISMDRVLGDSDLEALSEMAELSSRALVSALSYEAERNSTFQTITRLTAFYDIEKVFHSTLQMDHLLPIITGKIRELLPCDAVNLWMVADDSLTLMARDGDDPTTEIGSADDDAVQWVSEKGKPLLVRDPNNALLKKRQEVEPGFIRCLLAVPVVESGALVGVIECLNKADGTVFDEDDHFLLATIAESAAGALHNASLLEAERKVEILETLVEVSSEITSTLNLTRVLQVVVNAPQRIMAYDRGSVALGQGARLQIRAVSGKGEVVQADPAIKSLREMMAWVAKKEADLYATVRNDRVDTDDEEVRSKFTDYFKATGYRTWYSVPLADDQGQLGMMVFESRKADYLTPAQVELIKVLAAQATVALRNASLYQQVPLIGMLEPILHRKQQLMRMEKHKRLAYAAIASAIVLLLIIVPVPMRVEGHATVAPQRTAQVQVEEDSVIRAVNVREGQHVTRGTVLAETEDWEYQSALAGAQAKRQEAVAEMNQALADNDSGMAGVKRIQADYWDSEVKRASERVERSKLRSPIDGVVATPYLENMAGKKLLAGDTFAQVLDTSRTSVDVAVAQDDLPLVADGQKAAVKLEAFPTRSFRGAVSIVSPTTGTEGEQRVFYARVEVPNDNGLVRAGMQGQGKVSVGWHSAGYVLFRDLGMWTWTKLWNWFGW